MSRGRHALTATGLSLAIAGLCLAVVSSRESLRLAARSAKDSRYAYVLPPPRELRAATLGYRAAVVDLLWAKLLVEYGRHVVDKQPFDATPNFADGILALEPDFFPLFHYVGALLYFRPLKGTEADVRLARKYLEYGTETRPTDPRVWQDLGEFVAFVAPGLLSSQEEAESWRADGARAMSKAIELGADPDKAVAIASVLTRRGDSQAAIRSLEMAYALTDDPIRQRELADQLSARMREVADRAVDAAWRSTFPYLSRGEFLLIGPAVDPRRCVGVSSDRSQRSECAADFTTLVQRKRLGWD